MKLKWRRYEVLLPHHFNDGHAVPKAWLAEAVLEVVRQFEATSLETKIVEGHWRHQGKLYKDLLARLTVDIPDISSNRQWMKKLKAKWKKKLQQLEIWMVSYRIDVE